MLALVGIMHRKIAFVYQRRRELRTHQISRLPFRNRCCSHLRLITSVRHKKSSKCTKYTSREITSSREIYVNTVLAKTHHYHHHQPINVPNAQWGTGFPYGLHKKRTGHNPPRGPSAGWWVLTTAYAAGTYSLMCRPKHGGA
jgi:hypothetical protein